jgi:hypothetical protein
MPDRLSIWPPLNRRMSEDKTRYSGSAMTIQNTQNQSTKSIARVASVGLGFLAMSGSLNAAVAHLTCPLSSASGEGAGVLLGIVLASASQVLQACFLQRQWFLQNFFQMLVSFWLLLLVIAGAVALRTALKRRVERLTRPANASRKQTLRMSI